ncbi:MAG: YjbF family lipoprotein [Burkholderiales bacterium]|uniref:hypothetical protein n=1 Tax=Limnobacter sp. TaxID=2003368 RepID=UPI0039BD5248|nr:YjbF family lipoprotein [Burkholderiales bacterium]
MLKIIRNLLLPIAFLALSGCASTFSAAYKMIQAVGTPNPNRFEQFEMNPNLQYLEAQTAGAQAMMVLGYTATPQEEPPVQTWYDSQRELLRLQNGFLVSVTGVNNAISSTEYTWGTPNNQAVRLPTSKTYSQPQQQIFNKTTPLSFQAMPETAISTKNSVLRKRLLSTAQPNRPALLWFQEIQKTDEQANTDIPYSLYAFAPNGSPVYGSQCLTATACIEWLYRTQPAAKP